MGIKVIGGILIVVSCSFFGFAKASSHRREENELRFLLTALDYMQCELQYRLTPLPLLCRQASNQSKGVTKRILHDISLRLEAQVSPDVYTCVQDALIQHRDIPESSREALELLGSSLGHFDLDGQLRGMESVRTICRKELDALSYNRDNRLRSYQTIGLCAGAALAILFV